MKHEKFTNSLGVEGIIHTKVHDASTLREVYPEWDNLSKVEKKEAACDVEPREDYIDYNVTTVGLHEYFVRNLDPDITSEDANVSVSWLALGDDAASGVTTSDTELNNQVYTEQITDHADNGNELLSSTFVDSTEANGSTLDEIGLWTGDPANSANPEVFLVNHSTFSSITKDNTKTVTFDVTLTFDDV